MCLGASPTSVGVPVPAAPTVYVERHASHTSCAWEAAGLDRFLAAVADAALATTDPLVTVDARSVAGRERRPVSAVDAADTTYVRFETDDWRLAWERRTTPVVTLDGAVTPARCRRRHRATTADPAWPPAARERLADCLDTE